MVIKIFNYEISLPRLFIPIIAFFGTLTVILNLFYYFRFGNSFLNPISITGFALILYTILYE